MSNYSDNPAMCRVEVFQERGKWYLTEAVDMSEFYDVYDGVERAIRHHFKGRCSGMVAIVFDPYHKHVFPRVVKL